MKRILLLTILGVLLALPAAAQSDTYFMRTFTVHDGMPANLISGLKQDSRGLMWIATWNGLCCYDGYQFITFRGGEQGTDDALSSNRIAMIQPDSRDNVWVRTYDGGLYLLDTRECRFTNVGRLVERRFGRPLQPRNMYTMPSGHTWITDEHGSLNLRIDDRYPTDVERMEVIGTGKNPICGRYIRKVECDDRGREWIVTDSCRMLYGTRRCMPYVSSDTATVVDSAVARRLAVCGLQRNPNDKYYVDRQGNLWFTSSRGLTLVSFRDDHFSELPAVAGQPTRSLLCRRDGSVWAGSNDGHVTIYRNGQPAWLDATGRVSRQPVRFADRIYALFEDSRGTVWIGTKGRGLYTVGTDGAVSHYLPSADRYSLSHDAVYSIAEDAAGRIWLGTFGGGLNIAVRQAGGTLRFLHGGNELVGYPKKEFLKIRRLTFDGHGHALISTTSGLVTCDARSQPSRMTFYTTRHRPHDSRSLYSSDVMQTLVGSDGTVYVATMGGGIQRIADGTLLHDELALLPIEPLNATAVNALAMAEDEQGNVWIVRESGVECYQPRRQQLVQFGRNSMPDAVEPTDALPATDGRGRLWVGTLGGVLTFSAADIRTSRFRPTVVFTSVRYQGQRTAHPLLSRSVLTVEPDERNLTVSFAALDYADNSLLQYAYKTDDGQAAWNYIGHNPAVAFSQLPPGRHTLTVRSTNSDGVWVDNDASLVIDVRPTFWERTWVRAIALLLAVAAATWVTLLYLRRRRIARKREQRLENILRQYRELQQSLADRDSRDADGTEAAGNGQAGDGGGAATSHTYTLEEPKIVDDDEVMMNQLMQFIEQRIGDEELKVEEMAEAVNMSRTVFYGRVRSVVGMSPSDFLRSVRMQRASQLLARSRMAVAEVAYAVGFTDPKYFTKCFKKDVGMTPSEYRARHGGAA